MSPNQKEDEDNTQVNSQKNINQERVRNFNLLREGLIEKYVEESLDLRDRQAESIFKITDSPKDDYTFSSGYFNACTAFGKTYLLMAMAEGYHTKEQNKKIIILEETTDVLEQIAEDFAERTSFGINDIGAFYKEEKSTETPIIVCTYTSMKKMVQAVGKENIGLVLCDEAHHGLSSGRKNFIRNTFDDACLYGFTGTPEYNTVKNCRDLFETEIDSVDIKEGVAKGLLCSVKNGLMISKIPIDLTGIKDSTGDYNDKKLLEAISKISHKKGIRESLADYYLNGSDEDIGVINGKTTLINVPNKEEADKLAEVFNEAAGVTIAKSYHEESSKGTLLAFNKREFPVLIQVRRLSEGYNNPEIEVCINYPTASKVREAQCSGRALRRDREKPNKMALVLDIVFKKENQGDVYDQIAGNGQVLFKDIAEDICFLSPYRQKMHEYCHANMQHQAKDKIKISDDMLFDVVTSYEDLYTLAARYEEFAEQNNIPHRKENDIGLEDFKINYSVCQADGKKLKIRARKKLFLEFTQDNDLRDDGIIARLRDYQGKKRDFIIGDKLGELQQRTGYKIFIKKKAPTSLLKNETDIGSHDFRVKYNVYQADGTILSSSEKVSLFSKLAQKQDLFDKGIMVRKVVVNGKYYPFIPAEKISDFEKYTGYTLIPKDDLSIVPIKNENDIGAADYMNIYHIYRADGSELTDVEKAPLFAKFIKDKKLISMGVIATKRAFKGRITTVIVGDKLSEFTEHTGYTISATSLIGRRKDNDISYDDFIAVCKLYGEDGALCGKKIKTQLFNDPGLEKEGIIAVRKDIIGRSHKYIIGDRLNEFSEKTGYTIKTALEVYQDLENQASHASTVDERKKYLTQAKKIFERNNPDIKKKGSCTTCIQKIFKARD